MNNKYKIKSQLVILIRKRWMIVLCILTSSAIIVASTVYIPFYLGECYQVLEKGNFLVTPFLLMSVGYILRAVFKLMRNHLTADLGTGVVRELRADLCQKLLTDGEQQEESATYAYSLLSYEIETIGNMISWRPFGMLENILILLWSFLRVGQVSVMLLMCIIPTLGIAMAIGYFYGRSIRFSVRKVKESVHRLSDLTAEIMVSQKVIRTMGAQDAYDRKFGIESKNNQHWNLELARRTRLAAPLLELTSYLAMTVAVLASAATVIRLHLPGAMVVTIYTYMITLANLANKMPDNILFFVESGQSIKRIREYFNRVAGTVSAEKIPGKEMVEEIVFSSVKAQIGGETLWTIPELLLKRGNLTVIDGISGSGKTVLCNILSGFSQAYTGNITVNSIELRELSPGWYHKRVGYGMQKTMVFSDTAKGNVTMGRTAGKEWEEELFSACGLEEIFGKLGNRDLHGDSNILSGGERQRIGFARALYGAPEVVILDDIFTALDEVRRKNLCRYLEKQKQDHIIVIVSSYPEVLAMADQTVTLSA